MIEIAQLRWNGPAQMVRWKRKPGYVVGAAGYPEPAAGRRILRPTGIADPVGPIGAVVEADQRLAFRLRDFADRSAIEAGFLAGRRRAGPGRPELQYRQEDQQQSRSKRECAEKSERENAGRGSEWNLDMVGLLCCRIERQKPIPVTLYTIKQSWFNSSRGWVPCLLTRLRASDDEIQFMMPPALNGGTVASSSWIVLTGGA